MTIMDQGSRHDYWSAGAVLQPRIAFVLKGGGIRGLFFPGALHGLFRRGAARIGAFAGASAGALVATAIWSGFSPKDLSEKLEIDSGSAFGLFGLAPQLFSVREFLYLLISPFLIFIVYSINFIIRIISSLFSILSTSNFFDQYLLQYRACNGIKFRKYINSFIIEGLRRRGITDKMVSDLFGVDPDDFEPSFSDIGRIVEFIRTVSSIENNHSSSFEDLVSIYPILKAHKDRISFHIIDKWGYRRNNILFFLYGVEAWDAYFSPLFISVCRISDGSPIYINNLEERFKDIPICDCVRASAGHPLVFSPIVLRFDNLTDLYTDGGLINNFPTTAAYRHFARSLRDQKRNLQRISRISDSTESLPHTGKIQEVGESESESAAKSATSFDALGEYKAIISDAILTVGLSTDDIVHLPNDMSRISRLILGGAKDKIEMELSKTIGGFSCIVQKTPCRPHYLNFLATNRRYISDVFSATEKGSFDIEGMRFSSCLTEIRCDLQRVMRSAAKEIYDRYDTPADSSFVRAHLFFENGGHQRKIEKKAMFSIGRPLTDFSDVETSIVKENSGVIGVSRFYMAPVFCRMNILQQAHNDRPHEKILNLKFDDIHHLPELNFCFVYPIFYLPSLSYRVGESALRPLPRPFDEYLATFDSGIDGATLGLLSIDGHLPAFDQDMKEICNTILSSGMMERIERHGIELSALLTKEFEALVPGSSFTPILRCDNRMNCRT